MKAKHLLKELQALRKENKGFDDLDVYACVIDRESYEKEQAAADYEETSTDGEVYAVVVPTGYDTTGPRPKEIGKYLLIRAVEEE